MAIALLLWLFCVVGWFSLLLCLVAFCVFLLLCGFVFYVVRFVTLGCGFLFWYLGVLLLLLVVLSLWVVLLVIYL